MGDDTIAILPTAQLLLRNRDVHHSFRPDSDFYYLTEFPEPFAVAVILPGHPEHEYILFCQERDKKKELWEGALIGLEGACEDYGADLALPIDTLDKTLPKLLKNKHQIYYHIGHDPQFDQRVFDAVNQVRGEARDGVHAPEGFISPFLALHEMRLYKSRHEISIMRRAAKISARAHKRAMRACAPGLKEYQVEAELLHEFMSQGARDAAYPSIVGGGRNSCVLHYTRNRDTLADGDLLLIDAGAELDGYASDISRTFPVNGSFTPQQRAVYEIVLQAQRDAMASIKPGNDWDAPHRAAVSTITRGLMDLGILKGRFRTLMSEGAYKRYYMHRTGHWLGMDVHDVGDYQIDGEWRTFEPGMALTVEPGIYLPAMSKLAKKWHNIGIRIEDDVLVTKNGIDVLSRDAPKDPDDIEALMCS